MKIILIIGFVLLGLIPVIIIFNLFIYKIYTDLIKKKFENSGCVILTRDKIKSVLKDFKPSESIKIFKSGICDHSEAGGVKYFTRYPFGSKVVTAHDGHRRALIAHEIGQMLAKGMIDPDYANLCADILICLTDYSKETYYTQLVAWHSMSKLICFKKMDLIERITFNHMKECIKRSFSSGIGVIRFIFEIKGHEGIDKKTEKLINDIILYCIGEGSASLVALLVFKLSKIPCFIQSQKNSFIKHLPKSREFDRFMMQMKILSVGFTQEEVIEGLKDFGLQSPPYSQKSTEGEIVQIILKDFIEEIYVPASYILHSYDRWDTPRHQFTDFLWYK